MACYCCTLARHGSWRSSRRRSGGAVRCRWGVPSTRRGQRVRLTGQGMREVGEAVGSSEVAWRLRTCARREGSPEGRRYPVYSGCGRRKDQSRSDTASSKEEAALLGWAVRFQPFGKVYLLGSSRVCDDSGGQQADPTRMLGVRVGSRKSIWVTSFGLALIHKPAYEFRWEKTVVGRSSQKLVAPIL